MIEFHGMRLRESVAVEILRQVDWSATPVGAPAGWPDALKTALQLCMNSHFPMTLGWGPGLVTFYNDGYVPIMGSKHPAAFGRPALEVYAELGEFLSIRTQAILQHGEQFYDENALLMLDTGRGPVEAYFTFCYSPVADEGGRICGALSVATDTTASVLYQRRTDTVIALNETLAQHRWHDPVGPALARGLRGNADDFAQFALYGAGADGVLRALLSHPSDLAGDLAAGGAIQRAIAAARDSGGRIKVNRVDERRFVVTLTDDAAFGGDAFALAVQPADHVDARSGYQEFLRMAAEAVSNAVYRMLSDQQVYADVNRRLDQRERMYRLLFEHSQDGIFVCDGGSGFLMVNPGACRMLGYSEAELLALDRAEVMVDEDGTATRALAERSEHGRFTGVLKMRRRDGTEFVADLSSVAFLDPEAGEMRSLTLFRDATDRLRAQDRITAAARLEAVGQLTGGISHDFNNLLNVIIQGAEDLVGTVSGDAGESAELVLTAALQAAALTRQLLAFSRQQPLERRAVDVADTVAAVAEILRRGIGETVEVVIDVAPDTVAHVDPSLLQSAVLNLAINARDAMPGGGRLTIDGAVMELDEAASRELGIAPRDYVVLTVTDTGVGIAPEHLPRVIEPFFTTKPPGQGTGLGLSVVFGFAQQSGGTLQMRSELGSGTRVSLYLPSARQPPPAAMAAEAGEAPAVAGRRLLVVEDNDLLAAMLTRVLEGAGHQVTVCGSGEAALQQLDGPERYDLMITDIVLGAGMDGWTLAGRVQQRHPEMPVVTMSGYAPPAAGDPVGRPQLPTLQKPFRPKQVLALIQELLAS
ncbi:MAG: PAS domain S-box protein [Pseudomonadales bacterium]